MASFMQDFVKQFFIFNLVTFVTRFQLRQIQPCMIVQGLVFHLPYFAEVLPSFAEVLPAFAVCVAIFAVCKGRISIRGLLGNRVFLRFGCIYPRAKPYYCARVAAYV
jgi:hypothetical protein